MDKLKKELEEKFAQLTDAQAAKAAYLFVQQVQHCLTDHVSLDALDVLKSGYAKDKVGKKILALSVATVAAAKAAKAAKAANSHTLNKGWAYCALLAAIAANDHHSYTTPSLYAVHTAMCSREADPSIQIEDQIAVIDKLIKE